MLLQAPSRTDTSAPVVPLLTCCVALDSHFSCPGRQLITYKVSYLPQYLPRAAKQLVGLKALFKVGTAQPGPLWPGAPAHPTSHHVPSHSRPLTPDLLLDFLGGVQPVLKKKIEFFRGKTGRRDRAKGEKHLGMASQQSLVGTTLLWLSFPWD